MLSKTGRQIAILVVAMILTMERCASVEWNPLNWSLPGSSSAGDPQEVGSKAWWKKHKKQAEFVPGEGYRVEGYAGFYRGRVGPAH